MAAPSTQIDARIVPGFNEASTNAEKGALVDAYLLDCSLADGP